MMTVRERERIGTLTDISVLFRLMMTYRIPMMVKTAVVFERWPEDDIYYRCPRCQKLLERDFMGYCSSCGQCLDWSKYRKAKRVYNSPQCGMQPIILHEREVVETNDKQIAKIIEPL